MGTGCGYRIASPENPSMSLHLLETATAAPNAQRGPAARAPRASVPALAGLLHDLLAPAPAESTVGYAFEAALCQIESQSPAVRPVAADPAGSTQAQREAAELASRARLLARLLADVSRHLDAEDARVLYDAAARVAGELIAGFGPSASEAASDPTLSPADRTAAVMAAAEARLLAEAIGVVRDRLQTGARCPGDRPTPRRFRRSQAGLTGDPGPAFGTRQRQKPPAGQPEAFW